MLLMFYRALVISLILVGPGYALAVGKLGQLLVVYPTIEMGGLNGQPLTLADIARVVDSTGINNDSTLTRINLDPPEFSDRSWVSRDEMAQWLNSVPELADFEVMGPDRIRIQAKVSKSHVTAAIQDGAKAIDQHVQSQWPDQYRSLQYRFLGKPDDLRLYNDTDWEVSAAHLSRLSRRTSVRLTTVRDGASQTVVLWYEVTGELRAWRATADLSAYQSLAPEHFHHTWVSLSHRDAQNLRAPDPADRLTVPLPAGNVLSVQVTEPIPDIEYGQAVSVRISSPGLSVTTKATAKQTASVGEEINLVSQSSAEVFQAMVVAPGVVEVTGGRSSRGVH